MPRLAKNDETGEVVRLEGDKWVPHARGSAGARLATNEETGEVVQWNGAAWDKLELLGEPPAAAPGVGSEKFTPSPSAPPVGQDASIGRAQTALSSMARGIGDLAVQAPKAVAINYGEDLRDSLERFDAIDNGAGDSFIKHIPGSSFFGNTAAKAYATQYEAADPTARQQLRQKVYDQLLKIPSSPYMQAGEAVEGAINETFPVNPEYEKEIIAGQLPNALGQAATFMVPGAVAAKGIGALGRTGAYMGKTAAQAGYGAAVTAGGVTASGLGAGVGGVEMFEDALKHGASIEDAFTSSGIGQVIGASEGLPIAHLLSKLDKATGGLARKTISNVLLQFTEEGIQEGGQTLLENLVASKLVAYDPKRGVLEGVGEAAGVGATAGGIMGFLATLVAGRKGGRRSGQPEQEEPPPPPPPPPAGETPPPPPPAGAAGAGAAQGAPPALGTVVGISNGNRPSRRATVEAMWQNGQFARVRYEDGTHDDMTAEELRGRTAEAPPPANEGPDTAPMGDGSVATLEELESEEEARAAVEADRRAQENEAKIKKSTPYPALGKAMAKLERARRLREMALDDSDRSDEQRASLITIADQLEREYGAQHPGMAPDAKAEADTAAARDKKALGELGKHAVDPENVKEPKLPKTDTIPQLGALGKTAVPEGMAKEPVFEPAPAAPPVQGIPALGELGKTAVPAGEAKEPVIPTSPARETRSVEDVGRLGEVASTQPAPAAAPEAVAEKAPEPARAPIVEPLQGSKLAMVAPETINIRPSEYQFKSGGDEAGVVQKYKGTRWNDNQYDPITVLERLDGTVDVTNGHQRLGMWKASKERGQAVPDRIAADVYREADGYTPEDMRVISAYKNIAQGTGTSIDAAKIMRDTEGKSFKFGLPDLPNNDPLVREARGLKKLDNAAFGMVVNDKVPPAQAALVGQMVPDKANHVAMLGLLAKKKPDSINEARLLVEEAASAGLVKETQGGLFGDEEVAKQLVEERAQIRNAAERRLAQDASLLKRLNEKADFATEVGNVIATEQNAAQATADKTAKTIASKLGDRKGPLSDALNTEARALAAGDSIANVVNRFILAVRRYAAGTEAPARVRQESGGNIAGARPAPPREDGPAGERGDAGPADGRVDDGQNDIPFQRGGASQDDLRDLLSEKTTEGDNLALPGLEKADPANILAQVEGVAMKDTAERARGEKTEAKRNMAILRFLRDEYRQRSGLSPDEATRNLDAAIRRGQEKAGGFTLSQQSAPRGDKGGGQQGSLFQREGAQQTDTPEFKAWFGDSKVVENGEPKRMYHGTPVLDRNGYLLGSIEAFDREATLKVEPGRKPGMDTVGSWFSDAPGDAGAGQYAGSGGAIYPVYLNIKNPWRPSSFDAFLDKMHTVAGRDPKKAQPRGRGTTKELRDWLKKQGYDGIVFPRGLDNYKHEAKQEVWVALEPTQIKSATGNRGTFDPNDDRIAYSGGGAPTQYTDASGIPYQIEAAAKGVSGVVVLTGDAEQNREQANSVVGDVVADILGPGIDVKVWDELLAADTTGVRSVGGAADIALRAIHVSMQSPDMVGTARHEIVHIMRRTGMIDDKTWARLTKRAEADWMKRFNIAKRYPDLPYDRQVEEAIADAAAHYKEIAPNEDTFIRQALARIQEFIERIRNAMHGDGFTHWNDFFRAIERGDYKNRIGGTDNYVLADVGGGLVGLRDTASGQVVQSFETRQEAEAKALQWTMEDRASTEIHRATQGALTRAATADAHARGLNNYANVALQAVMPTRPPASRLETFKLGKYMMHITFPRGLAALDYKFARYWHAWKSQEDQLRTLTTKYSRMTEKYEALSPESRDKVDSALELDRLQKTIRQPTGYRLVVNNLNEARATKTKPGDIFALSAEESAAYFESRRLFETVWDDMSTAVIRRLGYTGPINEPAIRSAIAHAMAIGDKRQAGDLNKALETFKALEDNKRTAYVPFMRFGDSFIRIKAKQGVNLSSLGGQPLDEWFELVDTSDLLKDTFGASSVPVGSAPPKKLQARITELRQKFPASHYDFEHGALTPKVVETINLPALEKLVMATGIKNTSPQAYAALYDTLMKKVYDQMRAGWKRGSNDVPGWSTDFSHARSAYVHGAAGNIASITHANALDESYGEVMRHANQNVRDYAENFKQYMESPTTDFAKVRKFGFFMFLWGVPSSALVNLSQTGIVTWQNIGTWAGNAKAIGSVSRLMPQVMRAVRFNAKEGLNIDINKVTSNPDERAMLERLRDQGALGAQLAQELIGLNRAKSGAMRTGETLKDRIFDHGVSMFGTAEVTNRIVAALSAYRLAQTPAARSKAAEVYKRNQLFNEMVDANGGRVTPDLMAQWMVEETQFVMGKINRQRIARGPGAAVFQFKTFTMQFIRNLYQNSTKMGPEGKMAATLMLATLMLTAGLDGLPFAEDMRDISEAVYSFLTGTDVDFERQLRAMLVDIGFSKEMAEVIMKGPSRLAGMDLGARIGQGNFIPDASMSDMLGIPAAASYERIKESIERTHQGQDMAALAALMPKAVRDLMWASVIMPDEGVVSRSGTRLVAPSEIDATDIGMKMLGIQPAKFARRYESMFSNQRVARATVKAKSNIYDRLAGLSVRSMEAMEDGDTEKATKLNAEFADVLNKNLAKLQDEDVPGYLKTPVNAQSLRRRMRQYIDFQQSLLRQAPRHSREDIMKNPFVDAPK